MLYLSRAQSDPLHLQIYRGLRSKILDGSYRAGDRVPSTRQLAAELGVSRTTVLLAFDQLHAEGYVTGRRGSGTYVAPVLPDEMLRAPVILADELSAEAAAGSASPGLSAYARRAQEAGPIGPPELGSADPRLPIDFRYGEPAVDDFPLARWRKLITRAAATQHHRYHGPEGTAELRSAIADYLGRVRGIACRRDQIVITSGAQQAIDLIVRITVDPGDRVIIEDPQYQGVRQVCRAAGAATCPIPVDADGLQTERLPAGPARLAFVTPSHQFPTGAVMPIGRRQELIRWARRANARIVEDDYDGEFQYTSRPIEPLQTLDEWHRVIYVGTFSKIFSPALRLGYAVLPEPLVEPFRLARWFTDRMPSALEQRALAHLIDDGHLERHIRRVRKRNGERRAVLVAALEEFLGDRITVNGAAAGGHVVVWLDGIAASRLPAVVEEASAAGVGLFPVQPFYIDPPERAGLMLCYVGLTHGQISSGVQTLSAIIRRLG